VRRGRLERRIQAYLDGALSPSESQRLERVIARNEEASRSLESNRALGAAIRAAWTDGPPSPTADALLRAIRPELTAIDREVPSRPSIRAALGHIGSLLQPLRVPVLAGTVAAVAFLMFVAIPPDEQSTSSQPPALSGSQEPMTALPPVPPTPPLTVAVADTIYDLDQGDGSVTIFEGDEGATIIWVGEDEDEISRLDAGLEGWA
jgi:anti-sigma factor RsiW